MRIRGEVFTVTFKKKRLKKKDQEVLSRGLCARFQPMPVLIFFLDLHFIELYRKTISCLRPFVNC